MASESPQSNTEEPLVAPSVKEPDLGEAGNTQPSIVSLSGLIPTVTTVPTYKPRKFSEQIIVVRTGTTSYLYWFDATNNSWINVGPTSIPTTTAIIPHPDSPIYTNNAINAVQVGGPNSNTVMWVGKVHIPFQITANKISVWAVQSGATDKLTLGLYSDSGQTQVFSVQTAALPGAQAVVTTSLSSATTINAGHYWIAVVQNNAVNMGFSTWQDDNNNPAAGLVQSVTGKAILQGSIVVAAGTLPSTFDPTAVTYVHNSILYFRLDN